MKFQKRHTPSHVDLILTLVGLVIGVTLPLLSTNVAAERPDSGSISSASGEVIPQTLNRWSSNGPEGAAISSLAIDPSHPDTIYAGIYGYGGAGGVFKSTNGGESWSRGLSTYNVQALAIDPRTPTTLYATINGYDSLGRLQAGISKSTNGGTSWFAINNGLVDQAGQTALVNSLAIDPNNPNIIYSLTEPTVDAASSRIYKSTNSGGSWTQIGTSLPAGFVVLRRLAIDPINSTTIYAVNYDGRVFKTVNGGENWSAFNVGRGTISALRIDPTNPNIIYAGGEGGAYKSIDGAQSWSAINNGLGSNVGISVLAVDPGNPSIVYAGFYGGNGVGVFKSVNGGGSWSAVNSGFTAPYVLALAINPANTAIIYAGSYNSLSGDGIFKSVNRGASWSAANIGLGGVDVRPLAIDPANANNVYAGTYKSADNGGSWKPLRISPSNNVISSLAVDPFNPATVYAGADSVYKSTNGGESWSDTSLRPDCIFGSYISTLAIDPRDSNIVYAGSCSGVFKSTSGGASWSAIGDLSSPASLVIDPHNSNSVYAISSYFDGCDSDDYCTTVFKSADAGVTWNRSDTGTDFHYVYALAIDPGNTATIYVSAYDYNNNGIFKSTDGGASWAQIGTGIPISLVSPLVIDPINPNNLYAGSYGAGVFKSADGGATWNPLNDGLTNLNINSLAIDAGANFLHAGTPAGVFDYQLNVVCAYSISSASQSFSAAGAAGSVNVTATGGCNWQASSTVNWITINSGSSGSGDGTVNFTVTANTGPFPRTAILNIAGQTFTVNQFGTPPINSADDTDFFVRQHYLDFLNRQADATGLEFWANNIASCEFDTHCFEVKRIDTSAAFFLSIEFQQTGYLVYRIYKSSYGNMAGAPVPITLSEFLPDTQEIGQGVIVNQAGWEMVLEDNKQAFTADFVKRPRFTSAYPTTMTPAEFVDKLFANAGVDPLASDRTAAVNEFGSATTTVDTAARARALRRVAENPTLAQQEFNQAFVLMQYFGYLRRNPNDSPEPGVNFDGYNFWLTKLNQFNGNFINAEMVKAFITSTEYRQRFGP